MKHGALTTIYEDIAFTHADVLVNAGNGTGFMGGKQSVRKLCKGVAEHLNYYTQGKAEKAAKEQKRSIRKIFALPVGTVFHTDSCGLPCKIILHAVTMRYAGRRSSYKSVCKCVKNAYAWCENAQAKSIAFPLLGCGTGRLNAEKVSDIIADEAKQHPQITSYLYRPETEKEKHEIRCIDRRYS